MRIIEIEWVDSYGVTSSWEYIEDVECKTTSILSVGYMLKEDDACYVLTQNRTHPESWNDKQVCGCIAIPKCCVVNVKSFQDGDLK